jgi:hypothetical protein
MLKPKNLNLEFYFKRFAGKTLFQPKQSGTLRATRCGPIRGSIQPKSADYTPYFDRAIGIQVHH